MARFVCFGNARTPTWLKAGNRASNNNNNNNNTTTTTVTTTTVERTPPASRKDGRGGPVETQTPSSTASTATLAAATPTPSSRTLTDLGSPPARTAPFPPAGAGAGRRRNRDEVAYHRVCKHAVEFRLVQRRPGLVAMRRSRRVRHRRQQDDLAAVFRMAGEDKGEGEERPVYWDLLEKLDGEREG